MAEVLMLKPRRGGFLRPFGCAEFIKKFLSGEGPYGSPRIDQAVGAPQADIFHHYKMALISATALDRATRDEERQARRENRPIDPDRIEELTAWYLERTPYKSTSCRYHSFVVYFSNLRRLGWVEHSGMEEPSTFQDRYPEGPPRVFYRLTAKGRTASILAWANPRLTLYGNGTEKPLSSIHA
ncbi:MAG: hypothetical protein Q7T05_00730 [Dehalococcoidia bacterium]|nr:hypothetical protein [Dehalococcoidia bacterium]